MILEKFIIAKDNMFDMNNYSKILYSLKNFYKKLKLAIIFGI